MAEKKYILGIDGGGTKTRAVLSHIDGSILSDIVEGASNPQIVGFEKAAVVISESVAKCCNQANIGIESVLGIVAGIAGIGRDSDKSALYTKLSLMGSESQYILETDARIALEAALPWRPGIVIISGTGSIGYCKTQDGKILRAGGWGRVLGDEGSGFSIARDALKAVLRSYEGRGEQTVLSELSRTYFKVDAIPEIISAIRTENVELPGFAPLVIQAANNNDKVAVSIVEANAGELLNIIETLMKQFPQNRGLTIVLTGGLVESNNWYSSVIIKKIKESFSNVYVQKPKFPSVYGALLLAHQQLAQ